MSRASRNLCAIALAAAAAACSHPLPVTDDLDTKVWETQKALLPPYPKEDDLIAFKAGPARPFSFFVDRASISVSADKIVRYTLVARSASGAKNVSYEAIRCQTYERKSYAFGKDDGTWAQARNTQWLAIGLAQDNQQYVLADDYFCPGPVRTAEDAVQSLLRGGSQPPWLR